MIYFEPLFQLIGNFHFTPFTLLWYHTAKQL